MNASPWLAIGLLPDHSLPARADAMLRDDALFATPAEPFAPVIGARLDPEVVQLRAGLRRLIKRERSTLRAAERAVAHFDGQGAVARLCRAEAGRGGSRERFIAFVAQDAATVDEACELEDDMTARSGERRAAVARMGALLGYPTCCARAFAQEPNQDDDSQCARLLAAHGGRLSLWDNWVSHDLRPFSHFPCKPGCPETARLARETLKHMAALDGPFVSALEAALSSAALVQSVDRFALLLDAQLSATGVRYGGVLSHKNMAIAARDEVLSRPEFRAFYLAVVALLERGDEVRRTDHDLQVYARGHMVGQVTFAELAPALVDFSRR